MPSHQTLLCRYHYDPLDRLASHAAAGETDTRLFYQKSRLATQIQGALHHSVLQVGDQLLAQQQYSGKAVATTLLATDQQRSVLQSMGGGQRDASAYTAYGHLPMNSGLSSLLGFDGERRDPVTGHYLLGNGYRSFNPVLMRFNSPDSLSPFGEGGMNAYAYCQGDPVNYRDPTGHGKFPYTYNSWLNSTRPSVIKHTPPTLRRTARNSVASPVNSGAASTSGTSSLVRLPTHDSSQGAAASRSVAPAGKSDSSLSDGQVILNFREVKYGPAVPLKIYDDNALKLLRVQEYADHVRANQGSAHSHHGFWKAGKIATEDIDKFDREYTNYMSKHYEGSYGDRMTPAAKRAGERRIKNILAELVQRRNSR